MCSGNMSFDSIYKIIFTLVLKSKVYASTCFHQATSAVAARAGVIFIDFKLKLNLKEFFVKTNLNLIIKYSKLERYSF